MSRIPEKWKTQDGRVLLIREMSDEHLRNTLAYLRRRGFVSLRDWRDAQPEPATGFNGEYAQDMADQAFGQEWDAWLRQKPHAAIDAFHLEMAYRRRHGVTIKDAEARPAVGEQVDPVMPPPCESPEGSAFVADACAAALGEELAGDVSAELAGVHRWKPAPYRDPRVGDQVAEDKNTDWDDLHVVTSLGHGEESHVILSVVLHHKSVDPQVQPGMLVDISDFRQRYYLLAS